MAYYRLMICESCGRPIYDTVDDGPIWANPKHRCDRCRIFHTFLGEVYFAG